MSQGFPCICEGPRRDRMKEWRVVMYRCNYSAFNGYQRTPSDYSEVRCKKCRRSWRTKAEYADRLEQEPRI